MKNNHYEKSDCPSYAGNGKCQFRSSGKCAYNAGDYVCKVNGNLENVPRSKTQKETEESMIQGSVRFGREVMG